MFYHLLKFCFQINFSFLILSQSILIYLISLAGLVIELFELIIKIDSKLGLFKKKKIFFSNLKFNLCQMNLAGIFVILKSIY